MSSVIDRLRARRRRQHWAEEARTPGEGLGRLVYQIMWAVRDDFGRRWTAAQRVRGAEQ